jgi:drug/metabolite transporter (DMT)-like permease
MFMGSLLLFAAVVVWAIALLMSPHGPSVADGTEHVRTVVAIFVRNCAIGTLILCAVAGWLLFPPRRPRAPRRDWAVAGVLSILALTSLYQLFWMRALLD